MCGMLHMRVDLDACIRVRRRLPLWSDLRPRCPAAYPPPTRATIRRAVGTSDGECDAEGAGQGKDAIILKRHPTVTKDSKKIQSTTKVLLNHKTGMGR
jgi:hypothetical protein